MNCIFRLTIAHYFIYVSVKCTGVFNKAVNNIPKRINRSIIHTLVMGVINFAFVNSNRLKATTTTYNQQGSNY